MRKWRSLLCVVFVVVAFGCGPTLPRYVGSSIRETQPAVAFTHPVGIRFVVLPAGMVEARLSPTMTTEIALPWSRLISAHEVTNAQYEQFVAAYRERAKANPNAKYDERILSHTRSAASPNDDDPVSNVWPEQAEAFCAWLTENDSAGREYRLPESSTWEYAARGGQNNLDYPWGNEIDATRACYESDRTRAVGSYPPNPFGIYDMAGNVAEWVKTNDFPQYELRGGSWRDGPAALRIVARGELPRKDAKLDSHGFRVLCQPPVVR